MSDRLFFYAPTLVGILVLMVIVLVGPEAVPGNNKPVAVLALAATAVSVLWRVETLLARHPAE